MMFLDKVYVILYSITIIATLFLLSIEPFHIKRILTPITILIMVVYLSYSIENYQDSIVPALIGVFGSFIYRLCRKSTPLTTISLIKFLSVNLIIAMVLSIGIRVVEIIVG